MMTQHSSLQKTCMVLFVALAFICSLPKAAQATTNPVTCISVCESNIVRSTAQTLADQTLSLAITGAGSAMLVKIELVEMAILSALKAHSDSFNQSITFLAGQLGQYLDSKIQGETDMLKNMNSYLATQSVFPPAIMKKIENSNNPELLSSLECQHISSLGGVESQYLRRYIEDALNQSSRLSFENDERSLYAYGVAGAQRQIFDQFRSNWCDSDFNNGIVPAGCGNARGNNKAMKNLDLRITDIMFGMNTWDPNLVQPAQQSLLFSLGLRPMNPFNLTDLSNPDTQNAFMKRRALHARKGMADAAFNHLMSKRAPTVSRGQWAKEIMQASTSNSVQNANPGVSALINDIPEKVSFSAWANIMNNQRMKSTDYLVSLQQLAGGAAETELRKQMAMRLVQLRERYHLMERMLGLAAADYSLLVDEIDDRGP